jgi:A/G-specific adenine glycosylase
MLQQTQVATVIPYFERFMNDFPNVESLATAPLDAVLSHWSGLGYYARARNLHKAAQHIYTRHDGQLPSSATALIALPGIGQSTAHAILSLAYQQPTAICDGNVRRVLARWLAIDAPMDKPAGQALAWQAAAQLQSQDRPADYTQAIMDLGATLCTRSKPHCTQCPLFQDCAAYNSSNAVTEWPKRSEKAPKPSKSCTMWLLINNDNSLWLEAPQQQTGLWGGLYQLPQALPPSLNTHHTALPNTKHVFTHFTLHIQPNILLLNPEQLDHLPDDGLWYNPKQNKLPPRPAIVDKLYRTWLQHKEHTDDASRLLR